ncbi:MAG: exodeoxyribonuclease VII small subunit, partial [Gemmatimonadetes bacterium]|nr:exodeoxyribonuclease VII small subunit [Gemmatimonadota bacterium]
MAAGGGWTREAPGFRKPCGDWSGTRRGGWPLRPRPWRRCPLCRRWPGATRCPSTRKGGCCVPPATSPPNVVSGSASWTGACPAWRRVHRSGNREWRKVDADSREPGLDELIGRIEEIVRRLDSDSLGIDDALGLFEEGVGHLGRARKILERTELRIAELIGPDGEVVEERGQSEGADPD